MMPARKSWVTPPVQRLFATLGQPLSAVVGSAFRSQLRPPTVSYAPKRRSLEMTLWIQLAIVSNISLRTSASLCPVRAGTWNE